MNNEQWSFWLVWQFRKRTTVCVFWTLAGLIPWMHSTSEILQTTPTYFWATWHQTSAFLISMKMKSDLSGWFDNSEKRRRVWVLWVDVGVDPVVALRLRNAADYPLPPFGSLGTKLGHSWFQWKIKRDVVGWFDNSEKGDVSGHYERCRGWSRGCTPPQEHCRLPPTYF